MRLAGEWEELRNGFALVHGARVHAVPSRAARPLLAVVGADLVALAPSRHVRVDDPVKTWNALVDAELPDSIQAKHIQSRV